jgi:hypothetical protein
MISHDRLANIIDQIRKLVIDKKIKRFDLTASIDCFGPEQEYVRFGLDLDQWRQNFNFLASQKWITLNINQTLSALTIKTVPEMLQYKNSVDSNQKIGHYFGTTTMTYEFLHPRIFGAEFWNKDFELILNNMPENTWQQKQAKSYMNGLLGELNSNCHIRDTEKIQQLTIFLDEIDRRRNLDWKKTFPWLINEIEKNHVV